MMKLKHSYGLFNSVADREKFLRENMTGILGYSLVDMMINDGFCIAPASTIYHGNYEGGLFDHSYNVAYCLARMTDKLDLKWCKEDSPIRIGMLHDLCKIDAYTKVLDADGFHYEHRRDPIVKGHGEKSVIYALMYDCHLTEEEVACMLYHMGAYEKDRWDAYDNAIHRYPNVLFTHTADMEASKLMEA